jgi:hypothetical protein
MNKSCLSTITEITKTHKCRNETATKVQDCLKQLDMKKSMGFGHVTILDRNIRSRKVLEFQMKPKRPTGASSSRWLTQVTVCTLWLGNCYVVKCMCGSQADVYLIQNHETDTTRKMFCSCMQIHIWEHEVRMRMRNEVWRLNRISLAQNWVRQQALVNMALNQVTWQLWNFLIRWVTSTSQWRLGSGVQV